MPQSFAQWNIEDVILDLYKVTKFLGKGAFGEVYKVRHTGWNIDLAVKIPKPEVLAAVGGVENFEREAETWVNLGLHPHTVSCYYVRRIDNSPLVFAEYVAGGSLYDWIYNRKLYAGGAIASLQRILDIAIQFVWGLHCAHEQGLIHQDVKPANVMMTPEGVAKVTDFGLANARNIVDILNLSVGKGGQGRVSGKQKTLIVTGGGAMTPTYCSPEQANQEPLTRRTDLWSWAVSVLEMFQGERTWISGTVAAQALENYLESSENAQLPQMPMQVAQLLRRCFQYNPDDRPHNMLEVANELQEIYQQVTKEAYPRCEPKASKDIADSLNNQAVSLLDLGWQSEALQLWEQALQVQPQHPESTYNWGLILWRTARISDNDLLREMEEMRLSNPRNSFADYLLGLVHLERDDCDTAIKTLEGIQGDTEQLEEVQAALTLARRRLPHSKRLLRTFEGHASSVNSVCLSQDSRYALSGSSDKMLKLWDIATGCCLRTFEGHTLAVNSVCLSQDSCYALSGSYDKTLKLWDVATGRCLRTFEGHTDVVNSVCLSLDGRYALSGSGMIGLGEENMLKLWDVATGHCLRSFEGHTEAVLSVCISPDSRYALSGSGNLLFAKENTLKLWDLSTGNCLRTFKGHTAIVTSVHLSPDGQYALSGSGGTIGRDIDNTLRLWDVATGRCLRIFFGHEDTGMISSVCLSTDSRYALSGSGGSSRDGDNTLRLWDVATGRCLRTFFGHTVRVNSVCLSTNGRYALSGSQDRTLKLWAVNSALNPSPSPMLLSRVLAT